MGGSDYPFCSVSAEASPVILSAIVGSGCVARQSARAATVGSTPTLFHHVASSPQRWAPPPPPPIHSLPLPASLA